jgi:hypothetical protein
VTQNYRVPLLKADSQLPRKFGIIFPLKMATALQRKKTEFYVTLVLAVLGVAALGIASFQGGALTYAWFGPNRQTKLSASNMISHSLDTVASVALYPYHTLTASEGTTTEGVDTFEKTASDNALGKYSILKPDGNGVLLEVTLTDYGKQATSLTITGLSDATVFLAELDPTTKTLKSPLGLTGNSLSSIVCFYLFATSDIVDSGTYYSVTLANTKNSTGAKMTFVSSTSTIVSSVPMGDITGPTDKIYFVLDYDQTLIEQVYSANIGNSVINDVSNISSDGQSYISFVSDFSFWIAANYPDTGSSSSV